MAAQPHVLIVAFPAQGHINPSLHLAKKLIQNGINVTFMTALSASRRITKTPSLDGLTYATFSDGYDQGFKDGTHDPSNYMLEMKRHGSQTLRALIESRANQPTSFTCIVYSNLVTWVAPVAREFRVPVLLLWNQPATTLSIYYHYFNGYADMIRNCMNGDDDDGMKIDLPGLPLLAPNDMPSFFIPENPFALALGKYKEHIEILDQEEKPTVLINTFDGLEADAMKGVDKYNLVGIGPLFETDHHHQCSSKELEWLNSKPRNSVFYISLGSIAKFGKPQKEEIAKYLVESGRPFLWVMKEEEEEEEEGRLSCGKDLEKQGMIVAWCSQVEVLSHPSVGCFLTHCGWNSTFEGLVSGVPMLALPQWADQLTNAKLVQDVWRIGTRLTTNENGIVVCSEIRRCLELVMGDEIQRNAKKWKDLAKQAVMEAGSSDYNLKAFVADLKIKG